MSTMTPRRSYSTRAMRKDEQFTRSLESPLRLESSARKYFEPLQTMADRVGKDVEIFAEKLDQWYTASHDLPPLEKYNETLNMLSKFQKHAEKKVEELGKREAAANRGDLAKDVRRRIHSMANTPRGSLGPGGDDGSVKSMSTNLGTSPKLQELRHWQNEAASWNLLRIMIDLYHPPPGYNALADNQKRLSEVEAEYGDRPDLEIWKRFLVEDAAAMEKSKILKWLEESADSNESDIESIKEQLGTESGKDISNWTNGWLDTKSKIKAEKRRRLIGHPLHPDEVSIKSADGTQILVTHLDPDAPSRQGRALVKSDDYYERAMWMTCYEMLRRGKPWEEICEWCQDHNESWRGVSMGLTNGSAGDAPTCLTGPYLGSLWRRTCYALAQGSDIRYERAVYGLLSGDLKSVEEVCRTWDDHLYARYNALLLSQFDAYLQANYPDKLPPSLIRKFSTFDAVSFHGDWSTSNRRVVELLEAQKSTKSHAMTPTKLIQGSLIARNFIYLARRVGCALVAKHNARDFELHPEYELPKFETSHEDYYAVVQDTDNLRIVVHILLIFKALGAHIPSDAYEQMVDNTIVRYIILLKEARRFKVIPTYAAQLAENRQVRVLASVLPSLNNFHEQGEMCKLMEIIGIDTMDVVATCYIVAGEESKLMDESKYIKRYNMLEVPTSEEYLWPGHRTKQDFLDCNVATPEMDVIDSLEWFLHVKMNMTATFLSLSDAMKMFLLNGRVGAAIELCKRLPAHRVSQMKTKPYFGSALNFTDSEGDAERAALERIAFPVGISHPDDPDLTFGGFVRYQFDRWAEDARTYIDLCTLVTAIKALSEWREQEDVFIRAKEENKKVPTKRIKEQMEGIQHAVEPLLQGCLTTSSDDEEASQLELIRHIYLPDVILAYNSTLLASAHFVSREWATKSMELAAAIADEANAELADAFVQTGRMEELVTAFAVTSKAMVRLGERAPKSGSKKRGWMGESTRIWDLNVRN
ncbi:uncharacterized protein BDZ99DRAFT_464109 [Mytilinidion resinicola]|uniref:Nuclear pore complex protein n=1 Tax=Mytilinidion resinicola TaxID=574789 RepID=A0A6A6YJS6_9PEZI|nr:uncharacterized protein BDZ99DRAFT_464109 [Mytilinidion resinicola]KAF2808214.1 hypothetical protein BDZ99DRAFT_464109 [Mytilinidion resinicola]